jgi:hypothetical protein
LREPPLDYDIVIIEAHSARFVREQHLVKMVADQSTQLVARGWPPPLPGPTLYQPPNVFGSNVNSPLLANVRGLFTAIDPSVSSEQDGACYQEMKKRLLEYTNHYRAPQ